jgi:hypothetical protein
LKRDLLILDILLKLRKISKSRKTSNKLNYWLIKIIIKRKSLLNINLS